MGSVLSGIQSALTPPGYNQQQSQLNQQRLASTGAANALQYLNPAMGEEAKYATSLVPGQEQELTNMLYLASPGNNAAREQVYSRQAASNANQASQIADANDKAAGLSESYQAGNNVAQANNAAQASNAFNAQMNSPEAQLQQTQGLASAYQTAMNLPSQSAYQGAASTIYGRPAVPVGQGLGGLLGKVGGSLAGDYLGGG